MESRANLDDAELVAVAVATGAGLAELAGRLTDPSLLAVVAAAQRRLAPALTSEARQLLRAIGAFPGRSAEELRTETSLDDAEFAAASRVLLDAGRVTSTRFAVPACWVRTARGTAVGRAL